MTKPVNSVGKLKSFIWTLHTDKYSTENKYGMKLAARIIEKGYAPTVEGFNFDGKRKLLPRLLTTNLNGLTFAYCQFTGAMLTGKNDYLSLENVTFENCDLRGVIFKNAHFTNVKFINCQLDHAVLDYAELDNCEFKNCSLDYTSFNEANIDIKIINTLLIGGNFLHITPTSKLHFEKVILSDSLLPLSTKATVTKVGTSTFSSGAPIIGYVLDTESKQDTGLLVPASIEIIEEMKGIPVRIPYSPNQIDAEELAVTLKTKNGLYNKCSPAKLTKVNYGVLLELRKFSEKYVRSIDALHLCGGNNIEPEFYNPAHSFSKKTDYRRTMMEFMTFAHAERLGLPTIGICRGAQLVHIYRGGDLHQSVSGHSYGAIHKLTVNKPGSFKGILGEQTMEMVSCHHQAVKTPGKNIDIVASVKEPDAPEVVKLSEGCFGSPLLLTQSHPEAVKLPQFKFKVSNPAANLAIFSVLLDSARTYRQKKKVIHELGPKRTVVPEAPAEQKTSNIAANSTK